MSIFEFEKMSVIEKINFLCKNNNTLHIFIEISYQSNQKPWCARGNHMPPLGLMKGERSTIF